MRLLSTTPIKSLVFIFSFFSMSINEFVFKLSSGFISIITILYLSSFIYVFLSSFIFISYNVFSNVNFIVFVFFNSLFPINSVVVINTGKNVFFSDETNLQRIP